MATVDSGVAAKQFVGRNAVLIATLLAVLLVFPRLDAPPLHNWDEAWYARIALDIARNGTWLSYTDEGELREAAFKPPLGLWATAAAFRIFGSTEFAARLFSAVCCVALIAAVTAWSVRKFAWPVAMLAGFLVATDRQLLFVHGARTGDLDLPLTLFVTLTLLAAWEVRAGRVAAWGAAAFAAALLVKGPAALPFVAAAVVWLCVERNWRALGRFGLILGIGSIPYAVFLVLRERALPGFFAQMIGHETVTRFADQVDGMTNPWWLYFAVLLKSSVPVLLGLLIVWATVGRRPDLAVQLHDPSERPRLLRFLLISWLMPLAVLSCAATKRDWYIYPAFVPAYILAAWVLRAGVARLETSRRSAAAGLVAVVVVGGMLGPAVVRPWMRSGKDAERVAEHQRLVAALRAEEKMGTGSSPGPISELQAALGGEPVPIFSQARPPVLLYRAEPVLRWVIAQADLPYVADQSVDDLRNSTDLAARHARGIHLVARTGELDEVRAVLKRPMIEVLRLDQMGYALLRSDPDRSE